MKPIDTIEFEGQVHLERSISPKMEYLGKGKSVMKLYAIKAEYLIDWEVTFPTGETTEAQIGIWTKGEKVTEYDGVMEMPKEALELLKKNGFDTTEIEAF